MAIERGIATASTARNLLFLNPKIFSPSLTSNASHLGFARRRFECSVEYSNNQQTAAAYPKPAEIQWKKELCNTVHLIGVVGVPVEIKHLASGKVLAWSRLAFKKSPTDTSWISLTFWDELAHIAFQHVQKGQQIYVSGRLVSDTVESDDGKQQTYYKVVVQQLNLIEKSFSPAIMYDCGSDSMSAGRKLGANSDETVEQLWQSFFANPVDWWDNRKNKSISKEAEPGTKSYIAKVLQASRKTERNPKYPDFKHKDTGEALWIEGRYNPPWVKAQLAILDSRMESLDGHQDSRMDAHLMVGDNFLPF